MQLFEDLVSIDRSQKYIDGVAKQGDSVMNLQNLRRGVKARRGDGTFGQIIPGESAILDPGYAVGRGPVATLEIGVEVKILAKAMIKQIDRVITDLRNQGAQFRQGGGRPICVGIVGINHAERYTSYEKDKHWPTTGKDGYLHPCQEAREAERRLDANAKQNFDEFLFVRFRAANEPPFPFDWVDYEGLRLDYGAVLTRISSEYQLRF